MFRADLDRPLAYERHVFCRLQEAGWRGNTQQLRQLAHKGEELRRRYEAECSYAWAGNSDSYKLRTEQLGDELTGMAARFGLCLYIQGDPRGVAVYVDMQPLNDMNYSARGSALYWSDQ